MAKDLFDKLSCQGINTHKILVWWCKENFNIVVSENFYMVVSENFYMVVSENFNILMN
jgi:hypothetical protein